MTSGAERPWLAPGAGGAGASDHGRVGAGHEGFPAEREFAKADYIAAVERAKELIAGGDFMQVQVGQRIKKRYTESPLSLYRALRSLNPKIGRASCRERVSSPV